MSPSLPWSKFSHGCCHYPTMRDERQTQAQKTILILITTFYYRNLPEELQNNRLYWGKAMSNFDKAQTGLEMIKEAIISELKAHKQGMTNAEIVHKLGLESDVEGENRNYLSWSVLGILIADGKVKYTGERKSKRYHLVVEDSVED
jgi:hypothetical protein